MWLCVGGARRSNRRTGVVSIGSRRSATPFRRRRAHIPSPRARSGAPRGKRRHPEAGGCARDLTGPASLLPDAADVVFAGHVLEDRRLLNRRRKIPRAVSPMAITIHGNTPHPVSARKSSIRSTAPASEPPSAEFGIHVLVWAPQGTPCPSRVGVFPRVLAPTPRP